MGPLKDSLLVVMLAEQQAEQAYRTAVNYQVM